MNIPENINIYTCFCIETNVISNIKANLKCKFDDWNHVFRCNQHTGHLNAYCVVHLFRQNLI